MPFLKSSSAFLIKRAVFLFGRRGTAKLTDCSRIICLREALMSVLKGKPIASANFFASRFTATSVLILSNVFITEVYTAVINCQLRPPGLEPGTFCFDMFIRCLALGGIRTPNNCFEGSRDIHFTTRARQRMKVIRSFRLLGETPGNPLRS